MPEIIPWEDIQEAASTMRSSKVKAVKALRKNTKMTLRDAVNTVTDVAIGVPVNADMFQERHNLQKELVHYLQVHHGIMADHCRDVGLSDTLHPTQVGPPLDSNANYATNDILYKMLHRLTEQVAFMDGNNDMMTELLKQTKEQNELLRDLIDVLGE